MALKSINPFTQELIKEHKEFTKEETQYKILQAEKAFHTWKKQGYENRSSILNDVAKLLKDNAEEYAATITREMGKPIKESIAEAKKCAWACEYYAENGKRFLQDERIETDASESFVRYEPLGIVLGIMPWNFPFWQVFRFAVPTLMAGNSVLLKHASNIQLCAATIEDIFRKAGLPDHVYINLPVSSSQIEPILEHSAVKAVSLTGSEKAGAIVASQAAKNIKKSVLELGGSNPFIVLEDADMDKAIDIGIQARMQNVGQSCIAAKRFILHKNIAEEYINRLIKKMATLKTGDPMDEETKIGPLASIDQAKALEKQVNDSVAMGANLLVGGNRHDAFYEATLLTNVKPGMPAFDEETFGPVFSVTIANDTDEAIELANNSTFGLGVSIFTEDREKAKKLSAQIEDGAVFVNALVKSDPRLPFGGTKRSGFGRELSHHGIKEFVNTKTIYIS